MWLKSLRVVQGSLVFLGAALYFWGEGIAIRFRCPQLDDLFVTAGASILVIGALCTRQPGELLRMKVPQYLGRVSYSMYLLHGTVLFVLLNLLYGRVPTVTIALIYMVMTLAASHVFCGCVEEPSLRWGKRLAVGRAAARV